MQAIWHVQVRSLNALALLRIRRAECDSMKDNVEARMAASNILHRILFVLNQPSYSSMLSSWPDVQREHLICLKRLADLLSTVPKDARKKEEIEELLERASVIQAEFHPAK
eukprot:TRINITY_DN2720_c0_g1_i3.p2 TRINITY_DN2720_c0_g1~~TRINITY_DN2720_c0_g1_i3.p2  ORF type:complete len:111 (+),score=21.39 TRINITY_DN2720_c0_g1_i3:67-399(+)